MTTDLLTGATPAVFFAHVPARGMAAEIADWATKSRFDLLIGRPTPAFWPQETEGGSRTDGRDLGSELRKQGYTQIDGPESFRQAAIPVFGFLPNWTEDTELLAKMGAESFRKLAANPKGFFIMIEGSYPDSGGHGNNPDLSINGTLMVDFLVRAAVDFAMAHPDTLIVITADHETGGLYCAPNPDNPRRPYVSYQTASHTGVPVNVYAFGPGSERFKGVINNLDIPSNMAKLWDLPLQRELK